MSWLVTLMIFLSIGGALCETDIDDPLQCVIKKFDRCLAIKRPKTFPETTEDLRTFCRNFQAYVNCKINIQEECGYEDELDEMRHVLLYLRSVCVEDNPVFRVISDNLQCIDQNRRGFMGGACTRNFSAENLAKFNDHLAPNEGEDTPQHVLKCLYFTLDITCHAVTMGHFCGSDVKNAVEDVLLNTSTYVPKCGDIQQIVDDANEVLEAILLEELKLETKLKRRK